jgi:hypothetical protein
MESSKYLFGLVHGVTDTHPSYPRLFGQGETATDFQSFALDHLQWILHLIGKANIPTLNLPCSNEDVAESGSISNFNDNESRMGELHRGVQTTC